MNRSAQQAPYSLGRGPIRGVRGGPRCLSPSLGGRVRGPAGAANGSSPEAAYREQAPSPARVTGHRQTLRSHEVRRSAFVRAVDKKLAPPRSMRLVHVSAPSRINCRGNQVIPKLQPHRNADDKLDVAETLKTLGDELSFTQSKLRKAERTATLAERLDGHQSQVGKLKNETTVPEEHLHKLIDTINNERCDLLGELTRIGCADGRADNWPTSFFLPPAPVKTSKPEPARPPRGPASVEDWIDVANDRASDARSMIKEKRILGSVYMAGYAIECSLKALLRRRGDPFPTSGRDGHNLHALWKASGFQLSKINDTNGAKTYFIEKWCTDLRYDLELSDASLTALELVRGAGELVGYIHNQTKHTRGHR